MDRKLKLPIGIDNFEKIRKENFYYVDKTKLIEHLLERWGEVNLFTRPRRFGKTLNMSMLKYFFEIGTDQTLFDGLYISDNPQLKEEYMGKFPVIFLSLKGVESLTFENAKYRLMQLVGREANRFHFLSDSDRLTEDDKKIYHAMISLSDGMYSMNEEVLISSLKILSELLYKHYGKKTILLIDEYDVPLDKAFQIDNLWSILFTTGYLTQQGKSERGVYRLVIPNKEIREVYILQIQEWFKDSVLHNREPINQLLKAIKEGDADTVEKDLTKILVNTISIFDTKSRKEEKEIFYHGILLGLLRCESEWLIQSNIESGDGLVDILIETEDPDAGIIIELKYAQTFQGLSKACENAMRQIRERRYDERLRNEGRNDILAYGIAFCKKKCKVVVERL